MKSHHFQDKLEGEHSCEDEVEDVEEVRVHLGLPVELHGQTDGVEQDQDEDGVFERLWRHQPPDAVLEAFFWHVALCRLGAESELYAVSLRTRRFSLLVSAVALAELVEGKYDFNNRVKVYQQPVHTTGCSR